ncbi:hypothetical protein [Thalassorhabdomicrobium marinisediminis]|uniref:Uncharacterized protein n=1 Tax=Thalassorhabdomicrobium marinisediminis TaxID=2170577 RepID=A0A2T7FWE8_9RHOB|nr:hypothetical protein [Thalassorhabdomicrobium marinisediminis]PVA06489.1 hypothetical protein DC363_10110 [Thalassorhabdomicrobium marinisediminis]
MKHLILAALCATLTAGQASALSCLPSDVARAFQQASDAEERYVVLLGSFSFDMPPQTSTDINRPDIRRTEAQFTGEYLGADGFTSAPALTVDLEFDCLAAWCGALPETGDETLAFVEMVDNGYSLSVGPCFEKTFVRPSPEDVARVEACMRGDTCEEMPLR